MVVVLLVVEELKVCLGVFLAAHQQQRLFEGVGIEGSILSKDLLA